MILVNQHIEKLKPSATLAINQKVKELRCGGSHVNHFGFGQSPFPIHSSIVNTLKKNADNNNYLPTLGLELLRETIVKYLADFHKVNSEPKNVLIGPGSKELLYQTFLLLEGTFLIPKGSWVSYGPQIKAKGSSFEVLETSLETNFKLSAQVLENYCISHLEEQKILILNSPNNPTGAVYSIEELKELSKICRKYSIIVLSDEIYALLNFSHQMSPSIAEFYPEKTIVFGGLSKIFSAGGYRLGFLSLPKQMEHLRSVYKSLFSETFSAVASPIQFAAVEAFMMKPDIQAYIAHCSRILKELSNFIYNKLINANITCTQPQGAFYLMIGFNNFEKLIHRKLKIKSNNSMANYILDHYNVALLPASDFYFDENELYFRLAFVDFDGKGLLEKVESSEIIDENFIKNNCSNIYQGVNKLIEFTKEL